MVAGIGICQREQEYEPTHGTLNRFRFYTGQDSLTEVYFNGRTLAFTGHAIDQFTKRVPSHPGAYLTDLLMTTFSGPTVMLNCNSGPVLTFKYRGALVVFPVRDQGSDYIVPTCLSALEVNGLSAPEKPTGIVSSFDQFVNIPESRNWDVQATVEEMLEIWRRRKPVEPPRLPAATPRQWPSSAHEIRERLQQEGSGRETVFNFLDGIPGPCVARWHDKLHREIWMAKLASKPNKG